MDKYAFIDPRCSALVCVELLPHGHLFCPCLATCYKCQGAGREWVMGPLVATRIQAAPALVF